MGRVANYLCCFGDREPFLPDPRQPVYEVANEIIHLLLRGAKALSHTVEECIYQQYDFSVNFILDKVLLNAKEQVLYIMDPWNRTSSDKGMVNMV